MKSRNLKRRTADKPAAEPEFTGHEWDGIKEYNNPMPRWWLWTLYATIIWGIAYAIAYPAWPLLNKATPGLLGWTARAALEESIREFEQSNAPLDEALVSAELERIHENPNLAEYALRGGAAVFRAHCSQCHGSGGGGAAGYPNLLDDDWLWGGSVHDIRYSVAHGIRNDSDENARFSEMPAYGELLESEQIENLVQFVLSISGNKHDGDSAAAGELVFAEQCTACHGENGQGNREEGGPNLTDPIWLYGGAEDEIRASIVNSRNGVMPNWNERLTESQIRQVTLYVHQLGGGE